LLSPQNNLVSFGTPLKGPAL